uniref:VWFA domain-containing protein n=1 Tax=viral metagenome TaxID=1070528 RepID=A0A6C0HZA4_9ZZZZ
MSDIIAKSIVEFHTKTDGYKLLTQDKIFGVFFLEIAPTQMTSESQFVQSENDMSGSMSDQCNDARTKMQHLHLTLENIVNLFSKSADSANITLEITGFDDKIEDVIPATKIENDPDQVDKITKKIKSILRPRNLTNIEIALKDAQQKLAKSKTVGSKNLLFMTDGNITIGSKDIELLKAAVPKDSRNYFIGFGQDHDFRLLQNLASANSSGAYYYVDKIENAGLVFGEIIHSILYTALKNVIITTTNGEIYDFEKDEWTTKLTVPYLCGEANKQYHVRSSTPDTFEIEYSAEDVLTGNISMWSETRMPGLLNDEDDTEVEVDLRKYMYRQRTLELLADAAKMSRNIYATYDNKNEHQILMRNFRKELEEYAKEYSDQSDIDYMKQLCDDLYISEKTIHSDKSLLYTTARRNAQGRGGSYNITQVENYDDDEEDQENYEISRTSLNRTCTSSTQERVMRQCSDTSR